MILMAYSHAERQHVVVRRGAHAMRGAVEGGMCMVRMLPCYEGVVERGMPSCVAVSLYRI